MHNSKAARSMYNRLLMCIMLVMGAALAATSLPVAPARAQVDGVGGTAPAAPAAPAVPAASAAPVAAAAPAASSTAFPNSQDNYQGDKVTFAQRVGVKEVELSSDGTKVSLIPHCLEKNVELRGLGPSTPTQVDFLVIKYNRAFGWLNNFDYFKKSDTPSNEKFVYCDGKTEDADGDPLRMTLTDVQNGHPNRYGLAYGGLVVPFKFQLTGAHQLTGSATVGPYLGWRFDNEVHGCGLTPSKYPTDRLVSAGKEGRHETRTV